MHNKRKILLVSVSSLLAFFLIRQFLFYDRGLSLWEEGYNFNLYDSILKGKILFKDVYSYTSPLSSYFFALILKIFGSEILIIRLSASIVLTAIGSVTIFFILKEFLSQFWAWIGAVVSYSLYYLWWYSYGYEFGSMFSYLAILSAYIFIKKNKKIYFILTILFSIGPIQYNIFSQGIPLVFSILATFILFYRRINYKYTLTFIGSIILANFLIFSIFIFKSSFNDVFYNLTPFLHDSIPTEMQHKFPFNNVFKFYNVHFPKDIEISTIYNFLKGSLYIFIYYMPVLNIILFRVNYYKVFEKYIFPLKFLYVNILFYSIFSLMRVYTYGPQGHSDAFIFSPTLLFFYLNSYYVLKNIFKNIYSRYKLGLIKLSVVSLIAFFYIIIQIPNLNPELGQKEFTFEHIRGVKSTTNEVDYISNIIKSIQKYSKKGDYVYLSDNYLINVVTERPDVYEKSFVPTRPLYSNYKNITIKREKCKYFERELIELLKSKNAKIVCLSSELLNKFKENDLVQLESFIDTNYEKKEYFSFDQTKQKYVVGSVLDCNIFVLKENL